MRILFYMWDAVTEADAAEYMRQLGISVITLSKKIQSYNEDDELRKIVDEICRTNNFEYIFSFNYFPLLSKIAMEKGIGYIAWVYDSPHITLNSKTIINDCNFIFHFDYYEYSRMKKMGITNVFYLPMAVNADRLSRQEKKYGKGYCHDVSFIGNMYSGQEDLWTQIQYLPEGLKGYLEGGMKVQSQLFGYDVLDQLINEKVWKEIEKYVSLKMSEEYFSDERQQFVEGILRRHITATERKSILNAVSEIAPTVIYSSRKTPELLRIKNMGWADYETKMPEVFKRSKINLNITLRSIHSGIPLRVMDIMGAGGFALSNFQLEMQNFFRIGEELESFSNTEECLEKVSFYLKHETARERIAVRGCQKVRNEFNYAVQLRQLFRMMSIEL